MLRYALYAALVNVNHRRFAVGVCAQFGAGADNLLLMPDEIAVGGHAVQLACLGKQPLVLRQSLLACVFLQDDEVAAHFRIGVLCKEVVGQADGGDETRLLQHFKPYRLVAL